MVSTKKENKSSSSSVFNTEFTFDLDGVNNNEPKEEYGFTFRNKSSVII
jgi:hypothetical protein